MKPPKTILSDYLDAEGWDIAEVQDSELDWWADEIWVLSSRWSPEGIPAYLTFLVDPQHDGERKKGQFVWGIGCSATNPLSRVDAQQHGTIAIGKSFRQNVKIFLDEIEVLRSGAINDIGL